MLDLGCDPSHRDLLGRCSLHWAAKAGHTEVVEMLLEHTDMSPDLLDRGGCTPLHQVLFIKHNDTNNRSDTKNRYSNNRYNDTKIGITILKIGTLMIRMMGVILIIGQRY